MQSFRPSGSTCSPTDRREKGWFRKTPALRLFPLQVGSLVMAHFIATLNTADTSTADAGQANHQLFKNRYQSLHPTVSLQNELLHPTLSASFAAPEQLKLARRHAHDGASGDQLFMIGTALDRTLRLRSIPPQQACQDLLQRLQTQPTQQVALD